MLADAPVFAVLPCVDIERARQFYGETLGLEEAGMPVPEDNGPTGIVYQCGGGTQLLVYQRGEPTKADHTAAGWLVDDLEAVVDDLNAKGITMEVYDMPGVEFDERGIASTESVRSAWFKDPEGNILSLNELV